MKLTSIAAAAAALALAAPMVASAQNQTDVAKEMQKLRDNMAAMQARMGELENAMKEKPASNGMDAEQEGKLNRVVVKAGGLEDMVETQGLKGLKISGWIDPTFIATERQNRTGFQFLNQQWAGGTSAIEYAFDNGTFGMAQLDFQKEIEGGTKFRLTFSPNRGGLGSSIDGTSLVHEASISAPMGDLQTTLIAGQIPDWSGYEFAQANQTKLITHNLLFDLTGVAGYTGAGTQLVRGNWTTKAMLANVIQSKRANGENAPAIAYRVDYFDWSQEFFGFGFAGLHGNMPNYRATLDTVGNVVTGAAFSTRETMVDTFEVDAWYSRGDWSFAGQVSVGQQKNGANTPDPVSGELRDSRWWGVSGTASYKVTPRLEASLRADYLNNEANGGGVMGYNAPSTSTSAPYVIDSRNGIGNDGTNPENGANRYALSLGLKYAINPNVALKFEYRVDSASQPVFLDVASGNYYSTNRLIGASMVANF